MFKNVFLAYVLSFLVIISPVYASANIDLSTNTVKMCPCGTTQILGYLENTGNEKQTYALKSSSEWATIAPDKVTLDSGVKETVYVYLNPACNAVPDDYHIKTYVESEGKVLDEELVELKLLNCHDIELNIDSRVKTGCFEEMVIFQIYLKNTGKAKESFTLSSSGGILNQNIVEVKSEEEENILLSVPVNKEEEIVTLLVNSHDRELMYSKNLEVRGIACEEEIITEEVKEEIVGKDKKKRLIISIFIGIVAVLLIVFKPKLSKSKTHKKKGEKVRKSKRDDIKEILDNI